MVAKLAGWSGGLLFRDGRERRAGSASREAQSLLVPDGAIFTQKVLEAIPVPVFFKNAKDIYRSCNELFCKCICRDRKYIIGQSIYEVTLDKAGLQVQPER